MRVVGQSLAALAAAFVFVGLVGGQQPGGFGGKGMGFGGGIQMDAPALLRLDQVKKELNVTDEQVEKIPAAILKGLSGVLDAKQMTRLKQITLQQRKSQAYLDAEIQTALKITPEQKTSITTILADSKKELAEAIGAAGARARRRLKGGKGAEPVASAALIKKKSPPLKKTPSKRLTSSSPANNGGLSRKCWATNSSWNKKVSAARAAAKAKARKAPGPNNYPSH